MAKGSAVVYDDPINEVGSTDPNKPDAMGDMLYGSWNRIIANHLSFGPDSMMNGSANSLASKDAYGGPAKGEPNPAGMKGK